MKELSILFTLLIIMVNVIYSDEGINRKDLPVTISDEAWILVENIQKVLPLPIEFDFTRRDGRVTQNVSAQFVLLDKLAPKILIYSKDVTEQTLVHEILHANRIINGHPVLYRTNFPLMNVIDNLQNSIEHIVIYNELEKFGFDVRTHSVRQWRWDSEILKESLDNLRNQTPKSIIDIVGAQSTFDGLVAGIKLEVIKEEMDNRLKDGITNGILIYDELLKYDLNDKNDNLQALLKVVDILCLTKSDVGIMRVDYSTSIWYEYLFNSVMQWLKHSF